MRELEGREVLTRGQIRADAVIQPPIAHRHKAEARSSARQVRYGRPEGVVAAAGAAEVATNRGPMIIGGRSVTTGEDTGTASAIARSAARVRTRTGSAMTIPISRGSGRVQRQRPRSGDQEGERSLCGVQRSGTVRCGRGARGSRTDTRAPGTTPRLG